MRRPDPAEVVAISIPVLIEVVVVCLFLAASALWTGIWSHAI